MDLNDREEVVSNDIIPSTIATAETATSSNSANFASDNVIGSTGSLNNIIQPPLMTGFPLIPEPMRRSPSSNIENTQRQALEM